MADFNLVYLLDGKVYINLTNSCTNDCIFCIRSIKDDVVGADLFLKSENVTADHVIEQLNAIKDKLSDEIVFCGYGEPMLKLDVLKDVAKYIKQKYPDKKIRVNTNGHANFVYKRNVVPELKGLIDEFSVSLNGENEQEYNELSKPNFKGAYEEVKKFIKACSDADISVTATVVEGYKNRHLNLKKCEETANELGAQFRVREWIENGY